MQSPFQLRWFDLTQRQYAVVCIMFKDDITSLHVHALVKHVNSFSMSLLTFLHYYPYNVFICHKDMNLSFFIISTCVCILLYIVYCHLILNCQLYIQLTDTSSYLLSKGKNKPLKW